MDIFNIKKQIKDHEYEAQSAVLFGKHVSRKKGIILLIVTIIVCALPMLMGLRMWDLIPELIKSGRTFPNGKEDAIPRWGLVYGFPVFMCLINAINHIQLLYNQKNMKLPPKHILIMGRWGFPIFSIFFCTGMVFNAIGEPVLQSRMVIPCVLGTTLMLLGSHIYECSKKAKISLRFVVDEVSEQNWDAAHRVAGICWMAAGLIISAMAMLIDSAVFASVVIFAVALTLPIAYAKFRFS